MNLTSHQAMFDNFYQTDVLFEKIVRGEVDEFGLPYRSSQHKRYWWWAFENIYQLLGLEDSSTLLDVGSGHGHDAKVIHDRLPTCKLFGVEISPIKVRGSLLSAIPAEVAVAAAEELPLPDNSFTHIVSREVIEHVMDPAICLQEMRRVAKPAGRVVITTPNGESLAIDHLVEGLMERQAVKDDHMARQKLESYFVANGFRIQERFYDCAGYFFFNRIHRTPARFLLPVLTRMARPLEGHDLLSRLFCDQVKYTLISTKTAAPDEVSEHEVAWISPTSKRVLRRGVDCLEADSEQFALVEGKAPVFLRDTDAGDATPVTTEKPLRKCLRLATLCVVAVFYTTVYFPLLIGGSGLAAVLNLFGRTSTPCGTDEIQAAGNRPMRAPEETPSAGAPAGG